MMYIHYCNNCKRIHLLNGHKQYCPACDQVIVELNTSYMDYIAMSEAQRKALLMQCMDDTKRKHLTTTYRMFRYTKNHSINKTQ